MIFKRDRLSSKKSAKASFESDRRLGFEPLERRLLFAADLSNDGVRNEIPDAVSSEAILGEMLAQSSNLNTNLAGFDRMSVIPDDRVVIAVRLPQLESIITQRDTLQILVVYPEGYFSAFLPTSESKTLDSLELGVQAEPVTMRSDSPEHVRLMELVARASLDAVFIVTPISSNSDATDSASQSTYEIRIEPASDAYHAPWQGVVSYSFVVERDTQGSLHASSIQPGQASEVPSLDALPASSEDTDPSPKIEIVIEQLRELKKNAGFTLVSTIELSTSNEMEIAIDQVDKIGKEEPVADETFSAPPDNRTSLPPIDRSGVVGMERYQREVRRETRLSTSKLQPIDFFLLTSDEVDQVFARDLEDIVANLEQVAIVETAVATMPLIESTELDPSAARRIRQHSSVQRSQPRASLDSDTKENEDVKVPRRAQKSNILGDSDRDAWVQIARTVAESPIANMALACITTASRRPFEQLLSGGQSGWELVEKPPRSRT